MATLQVPGAELHYEVTGTGCPVVFAHGLALDTRMWDDQAPLSEIAAVIRYDARGFGRSRRTADAVYTHAADLWQLLDHLEIDTAVLVGLSLGGRIVTEAALAAPGRVTALVLLDAVVDGVPWDAESSRGMRAVTDGLQSGGLAAARAAWLEHGFFAPARRQPAVASRLAQMVADYSGVHWTQPDPHGPHPDTLALLPSLGMPATVVAGELDVPCFLDMADVLATAIPAARKVVIPDAGHMVNMEAPAAVNLLLREVIQGVQDAASEAGG
ncbi:MAG TPA: alpha/beta hydrolase [Streptosporangiaceae bacterium]|jgi:pimeloyl-ACP methyl ester carboxylesterase